MKIKSILLVDDHPLFREGIKTILSETKEMNVVGETGNGADALKIINKLKPDMIIIDISLPDTNGIELAGEILKNIPNLKILFLSMHSKLGFVSRAFKSGADGYLLKESAGDKLLDAIKTIEKGEYYLDNLIAPNIIDKLINTDSEDFLESDPNYDSLTTREQEIMKLLVEGVRIKEISEKLFISPKTVENHKINTFKKLNITNIVELVKYATKIGLID